MNQTYRIGDQVLVHIVGTIHEASVDNWSKEVKYKVVFEAGDKYLGCAYIKADGLIQPNEQRMSNEEMKALFNSK